MFNEIPDDDGRPNRFRHNQADKPLQPVNQNRTELARLLSTPIPPPVRGCQSRASTTLGATSTDVESRVAEKMAGRRRSEIEGILSRVDTDHDGKLTSPQLRDVLRRLLIDISDSDFLHLFRSLEHVPGYGLVSIKEVTMKLLPAASSKSSAARPATAKNGGRNPPKSRPGTAVNRGVKSIGVCPGLASRPGSAAAGGRSTQKEGGMAQLAKLRPLHKQVLQKMGRMDRTSSGWVSSAAFFDNLEHFECGVSKEDQHGLMARFGDPTGCRVNYVAVIKAIL